jgi:hypothetical protein
LISTDLSTWDVPIWKLINRSEKVSEAVESSGHLVSPPLFYFPSTLDLSIVHNDFWMPGTLFHSQNLVDGEMKSAYKNSLIPKFSLPAIPHSPATAVTSTSLQWPCLS